MTSHAKTFLVVCSFQRIAICMPCIYSHSNGLGGPIILFERPGLSVQKKFASVCIGRFHIISLHPFKNFSQPSAVYPFDCICAKSFFIRASVWLFSFELLGSPFLVNTLAVRSLAICSFLRNVFEGEVTIYINFKNHNNSD